MPTFKNYLDNSLELSFVLEIRLYLVIPFTFLSLKQKALLNNVTDTINFCTQFGDVCCSITEISVIVILMCIFLTISVFLY